VIPFLDLKRQNEPIRERIDEAIRTVIDSCQFALGGAVEEFEKEFASYCDSRFAVAVNSGTSALHLALLSPGIGEGDEVITTPATFIATVAAIRYAGARPVFVDIDPRTCTLDVDKIESAITSRTKAIIPVHLYGQCADMDPINDIAERHGLTVIEDACQAHGAEYKRRRAGSIGHLGCFSFYPGKNLGAFGEGGIVVTSDPEHASRLRMMRDWGQKAKGVHALPGFNYRMDGIQGAVLRVKLSYLNEWNAGRAAVAERYRKILEGCDLELPHVGEHRKHSWHIYAVRTRERDALRSSLLDVGVQSGIHYLTPAHLHEAHNDLGYRQGDFPHAERLSRDQLSLPIFPELRIDEQDEVAAGVLEAMNAKLVVF
jgi:dTDP-4-amino-4,6-dideoxygalactose transaminase